MTNPAHPRPPQVTLAGWMIIVGSLLVVGSVFEMIGGLRSLQTREAIDSFLAEPPGDTLGWGPERVLTFLRVTAMVTAGCATAAAVLGWHALRRNRSARVGLTVLAFPLFVTGIVTGGFMSSLVAAASLMLWLQPARDWFDGKKWTPPGKEAQRGRDAAAQAQWPPPLPPGTGQAPPSAPDHPVHDAPVPPAPGQAPGQGPGAGPRAVQGFGERPSWAPQPTPQDDPWAHKATGRPVPRPDVVLVAAILTWVFAGFTLLSSSLSMLVLALSPQTLTDELERQEPELAEAGVSQTTLLVATLGIGALVVVWSLAAVVAAVFLMRRARWAHTLLLVLAVGAAIACSVSVLAAQVMALPALAALAVAILLRRPDVRAWVSGPR